MAGKGQYRDFRRFHLLLINLLEVSIIYAVYFFKVLGLGGIMDGVEFRKR